MDVAARRSRARRLQAAARVGQRDGRRHRRSSAAHRSARAPARPTTSRTPSRKSLPTITRSLADIVRISPLFNSQGGGAGDGRVGRVGRGQQLPLQQPADRRRGEQRPVRPGELGRHAGRHRGNAADQPRRHPGNSARRLAVRRAPGRLHRRRHQRHHQERHEQHPRHRRSSSGATRTGSARAPTTGRSRRSRTSRAAAASAARSCRTRRSSSARRTTAASSGRPASRSTGAARRSATRRSSIGSSTSSRRCYGYDPGEPDRGVHQGDRQRQVFRPRRLQRGQEPSADGPPQLHRRVERHQLPTSSTTFRLPDAFYRYVSKTNSTVGQLNSQFGKGVNELRLTLHARARSPRTTRSTQPPFPQVRSSLDRRHDRRGGHRDFSARNAIDQDIIELNDAYTLLKGKHTFTVGTHNEFLEPAEPVHPRQLRHLPLHQPRHLRAGLRAAVRPQLLGDERSAAAGGVQGAASGASTPAISGGRASNVTLTYGVRLDAPTYPDEAERQPGRGRQLRLSRPTSSRTTSQWSPRVGFNWDLSGNGTAADPRRRRALHRPAGLRLDLEPVRQHRHRLHPHRRGATTPPTAFRSSPIRSISRRP